MRAIIHCAILLFALVNNHNLNNLISTSFQYINVGKRMPEKAIRNLYSMEFKLPRCAIHITLNFR